MNDYFKSSWPFQNVRTLLTKKIMGMGGRLGASSNAAPSILPNSGGGGNYPPPCPPFIDALEL